jgi:hypothetical protein
MNLDLTKKRKSSKITLMEIISMSSRRVTLEILIVMILLSTRETQGEIHRDRKMEGSGTKIRLIIVSQSLKTTWKHLVVRLEDWE